MMVPIETLLSLTVVFFIREVCMRSKKSDYDIGYTQALNDIADEWNRLARKKISRIELLNRIGKFIQQKMDGM